MITLSKLCGRLPIVVFFALALLPTIFLGFDGPAIGTGIVPANSAAFPSHFSQQILKDLGQWFARHVGFRLLWRYIGLQYHLVLLRWPIASEVAFGRDGWLFYTDDQDTQGARMLDFRGVLRFRPDQIATIKRTLKTVHDGLAACGITFMVVIVPNKQSIYGNFLGGNEASVRTRLDDMLDRLDASIRSTILDLRPPLRAAAAQQAARALYWKTDTHWNALGAFYAYRAVLDRLVAQDTVSYVDHTTLDNFRIVEQPSAGGDIARILLMPDLFPDTEVSLRPRIAIPQIKSEQTGAGMFVYRRIADSMSSHPLLLFGDSFAPSLAEPLARQFGTVYVRPPAIDPQEIGQLKPSIVVFETVARYEERLIAPIPHIERACGRLAGMHAWL